MPRKTRKQKLKLAQKRQSETSSSSLVKREFEFTLEGFHKPTSTSLTHKRQDKSLYFDVSASTTRDIAKTAWIAILIFSLELVIYFALN